jgi:hypothetical protein
MIDMNKPFGMTAITRQDLEDMPCPIMASELTDEQMQELANIVEMEVRDRYPEVADKMFELWKKEDRTDEEQDFLDFECDRAEEFWWDMVEEVAVKELGASYYEDIV